ncbi:NAD(P)/FAD-dependent oxidoreductase [Virgibacillus alimentarius]|uniref:NAD(P)/FAD-dependent oxidoreductase n=1 Tax=Virgibacillus alimentarius TaxID=698769 RepID=UPI000493879E|nr:FAD-binding oxidoreductase [Virgibacillus alimentarius]
MQKQTDIIIVGGGVIGSSIAYHLLEDGYTGDITIFEKDKRYEFSSTPRSAGGIRQLFTTGINIEMGKYAVEKYAAFPEEMKVDGERAEIDFQQHGYLFLVSDEQEMKQLERQAKLQEQYGVRSKMLGKADLLDVIPELNLEDIAGGLYSSEDGYLDPYSVMQGYAKKAKQLGATFVYEEVHEILKIRNHVSGVKTADENVYHAPVVINCAGPWAPYLSETVDLPIPVTPLKRQIIQFNAAEPLEKKLPLTVDPSGVYFRHEGSSIISGYSEDVKPGIDFSWKRSFFMDFLWPILANRVPNFEKAKIQSGWAGIYSHNTVDQNAIIGEHPDLKGYHLAVGFSGHGMQQAPAVGKGLSEYIRTGAYETIDFTPLRFERFYEKDFVIEEAIV